MLKLMNNPIGKYISILALCASMLVAVFAATAPAASARTIGAGNVTITSFSGDIIVGTCSFGTVTVQGSGTIVTTPGVSIFHVSGSGNGWTLSQSDIYVHNGVSVGTFDFSNPSLGADIQVRFVSTNGVDLNFSQGDC